MKRKPTNSKKTIKKRIEHSQSKYEYIERKGSPVSVDLVMGSRESKRNILRRGGNAKSSSSPKPFQPILVDKKPISIIISAYQSYDYIEECLNSIEYQTYFDKNNKFEILVGVDGCEKTLDKLLEIKHKYKNLRIFMMNENRGTYITSNTLISKVKYNNIIRFDSDDVMMLEMVNEIMCYYDEYNVVRLRYVKLYGDRKEPFHAYAHGVLFMKSEVFKQLGGYKPWKCAADTEFLKRGKKIMNEKYITRPLFYRRMHGNSLTGSREFGPNSEIRKHYRDLIRNTEIDYNKVKIRKKMSKYVEY